MNFTLIRRVIGIIFILISIVLLIKGINGADSGEDVKESISSLSYILKAFVFLILGLMALGWEMATFITSPISSFLFSSEPRLEKPPLNYKLIDFYIKKEEYEKALEEFEKFRKYYPKEVRPYNEAAMINAEIFEDFEESDIIINQGISILPDNQVLKNTLNDINNLKKNK